MGLRDNDHPGRPRRITEEELAALEKDLQQAPHHARHWVWKRCRRSLKAKQDPAAFEEGQRVLNALQAKEASGAIDLFYMDESGFSVDGCIPYAWQPQGKTLELPANATGRVNVIGLVSRQGESYFHPVETTVTSSTVAEAMADLFSLARRIN